jgi:hypothetical protein
MTVRQLLSGATLAAAITILGASSASAQQGFFNYSDAVTSQNPLLSNSGLSQITIAPRSNNTGVNANIGSAIVLPI